MTCNFIYFKKFRIFKKPLFSASILYFSVINPSTGEVIGKVPDCDVQDTQDAITAAKNAFPKWSGVTWKVKYLQAIDNIVLVNMASCQPQFGKNYRT